MNDDKDDEQEIQITPELWAKAKEMAQKVMDELGLKAEEIEDADGDDPNPIVLNEKQKMALAQRMIAPISKPRHYALQGKLMAHAFGAAVDISEEEWKQAEALGLIEPLEKKE